MTHDYVVRVSPSLDEMHVTANFAEPLSSVSARSRTAGRFLDDAVDCATGDTLKRNGRRIEFDALRCIEYTVDLAAAARADDRNWLLDDTNVVVSPTVWMWRPRLGGRDAINITFQLDDDARVSVPWQPVEGARSTYRLRASPQSGSAMAIFGRFDSHVVDVAGVGLRVIALRGRNGGYDADDIEWVRDTAGNITLAYSRFPNPHARVVLLPGRWRSQSAVVFGRVVRDGGETIELFVNPDGALDDMYRSWMPTHEFSHLMVPYIGRERRWISEGFAQYYQNLLLARAGQYTELEAWQKLGEGLQRGRASTPHLSPNEATEINNRGTRMKVYWSGAALALIADVELRRRSDNQESLDAVLGQLQRCCLPSRRIWSGLEFFQKLDELIEEPLFVDLYRRIGDTRGFPEFDAVLEELGVQRNGNRVRLDDDAPLAKIRAALTARRYTDQPNE